MDFLYTIIAGEHVGSPCNINRIEREVTWVDLADGRTVSVHASWLRSR